MLVIACLGGCSYRMGSLFGRETAEPTGSVRTAEAPPPRTPAAADEGDLAIAKRAAAEMLSRPAGDAAQPWENPSTGARGTVTAIASAYTQDGLTCRDFLASYVLDGRESWWQGGACRVPQGRWEVRDLRPWKRS